MINYNTHNNNHNNNHNNKKKYLIFQGFYLKKFVILINFIVQKKNSHKFMNRTINIFKIIPKNLLKNNKNPFLLKTNKISINLNNLKKMLQRMMILIPNN